MNVHITLTEIVTSLMLYSIVHGFIWLGKNAERLITKLIVTERQRITHAHVKEGHVSTLLRCNEGRCSEVTSTVAAEAF